MKNTTNCECEDVTHSEKTKGDIHAYMAEVGDNLVIQETIFGKFKICNQCVKDHPIPDEYLI